MTGLSVSHSGWNTIVSIIYLAIHTLYYVKNFFFFYPETLSQPRLSPLHSPVIPKLYPFSPTGCYCTSCQQSCFFFFHNFITPCYEYSLDRFKIYGQKQKHLYVNIKHIMYRYELEYTNNMSHHFEYRLYVCGMIMVMSGYITRRRSRELTRTDYLQYTVSLFLNVLTLCPLMNKMVYWR